MSDNTTLLPGEYHPAANSAMAYVQQIPLLELMQWQEALASTALSGDRNAEICSETLHRVMSKQDVSDRYLLGLAWTLRELRESK